MRRHCLLQWGCPELPAGPTSTTHTPLSGLATPEPPATAVRVPHFGHGPEVPTRRGAAPISGPKPRPPVKKNARPPARARRVTAPPFPHPDRTVPPWGASRAPPAVPAGACPARGPLGRPPAAAPCPLTGSPALGGTASTARARLRFRLRLVQTARPRPLAR